MTGIPLKFTHYFMMNINVRLVKSLNYSALFESKSTISKQIYDLFESCFGNEFRKPYHECEEITEILINIQSSK